MSQFESTERLIGRPALDRLLGSRAAVFGLGGVGGIAAEALARSGVGSLDLFDGDRFSPSNLNRQVFALHSTLGMGKAEAARRRILDIHPGAAVVAHSGFYLPENAGEVDLSAFGCILDAMDHVAAKAELAARASALGVPLVSALGAGNRLDPSRIVSGDIRGTSHCPLARALRRELARRGVESLRVVYSTEPPLKPFQGPVDRGGEGTPGGPRRPPIGSLMFVPCAMGLALAAEGVKALLGERWGRG